MDAWSLPRDGYMTTPRIMKRVSEELERGIGACESYLVEEDGTVGGEIRAGNEPPTHVCGCCSRGGKDWDPPVEL